MPKLSITPLFEKLLDEDTEIPFEKVPKAFMTFEELQKSIMDDVSRLLNTRISVFWKDYAQKKSNDTIFIWS
jgi:predicted component of type VI protein secretion system